MRPLPSTNQHQAATSALNKPTEPEFQRLFDVIAFFFALAGLLVYSMLLDTFSLMPACLITLLKLGFSVSTLLCPTTSKLLLIIRVVADVVLTGITAIFAIEAAIIVGVSFLFTEAICILAYTNAPKTKNEVRIMGKGDQESFIVEKKSKSVFESRETE
jgi:hypothetical protein